MKKPNGKLLLDKLRKGSISADELALLETWYNEYARTARPNDNIGSYVNNMKIMDMAFPFTKKPKQTKFWPRIAGVAAAIAIIASAVYFLSANHYFRTTGDSMEQIYTSDVAPGKTGATLTLANGKRINLSSAASGELARSAGVVINKSANGELVYEIKGSGSDRNEINTLTTAKGESYKVRLPDGSLVYLNAASSLTYLTTLTQHGKRMVRLRGEGYFEVHKDKLHPFIVETDRQRVEVLGTHFNINAYRDEPSVKTTLVEGSVQISSTAGKIQTTRLKPNQQSILMADNVLIVKNVEPENAIDWKSNDFVFNGENFKTAMRKIARWYDMDVIYDEDIPEDIEPGGWISRKNNISVVLKRIESSGQVHFKIEGRRLRVTR